MPYERYDSEEASLGGGAFLISSPDHSQDNIASQASKQSYIKLPKSGSYAEWTMHSAGMVRLPLLMNCSILSIWLISMKMSLYIVMASHQLSFLIR